MTMAALRSSSVRCWFSRRSFCNSSSCGLRLDLGPRLWGVKPLSMPASRSRRQGDQVRGVEAFPAEQGPDGAGLSGGGIGLGQEAQLVFGGEGPTLGAGDNLRVRSGGGGGLGRARLARRCTTGVLAPLGLPTLRGGQSRGGVRSGSIVLHIDSCSRPAQ